MLTAEQIAARRGRLSASRIKVLMEGDAEGIMQLWLELTNDPTFVPIDLSRVWAVRLGEATEDLNVTWFEMKNGPVTRRGEVVVHPDYPWACSTLDGWHEELKCVVEAKCVGGREPMEVVIDRYAPQTQWQMFCTESEQCALSVIMGASEPVVEFLPRSEEYIVEMVKRGRQFMEFVRKKIPPVALEPVPPPVDASVVYDFSTNNEWCHLATDWIDTKPFAEKNKDCEKILKARVPPDAKKTFGGGVRITRDRAGRLSLREEADG